MDLPVEIILIVTTKLALDDLFAFQQTSRIGSSIALRTKIDLPRLLERNHSSLYRHMLIAGTVEQIGNWAIKTSENEEKLRTALLSGIEGLLELSTKLAFVRLGDLQHLYQMNRNVLHPLSGKLVDEMHSTLDLPGAQRALWNYLIYCGLFHHSYEEALKGQGPTLNVETQKIFLMYCVPFDVLASSSPGIELWSLVRSELFRAQNELILGSIFEFFWKTNRPFLSSPSQLRVLYVIQSSGEDFLKHLQSGKSSYDILVNGMLNNIPTAADATEERTWEDAWQLERCIIRNVIESVARVGEGFTG